jgi:hypothetical protein
MNTFGLAAALGILLSSPSGGTIWGNVVVLIVGSSVLIITLLSSSMREHVSSRRSLADSHTLHAVAGRAHLSRRSSKSDIDV